MVLRLAVPAFALLVAAACSSTPTPAPIVAEEAPTTPDVADPDAAPATSPSDIPLPTPRLETPTGRIDRIDRSRLILQRTEVVPSGWTEILRVLDDGSTQHGRGPTDNLTWTETRPLLPPARRNLDELRALPALDEMRANVGQRPTFGEPQHRVRWEILKPDGEVKRVTVYGHPQARVPLFDHFQRQVLAALYEEVPELRGALDAPAHGGFVPLACRVSQVRDIQPLAVAIERARSPGVDPSGGEAVLTLHTLDPAGGMASTLLDDGRVRHIGRDGTITGGRLSDADHRLAHELLAAMDGGRLTLTCP